MKRYTVFLSILLVVLCANACLAIFPGFGPGLALRSPYLLAGLLVVGASAWQGWCLFRRREGREPPHSSGGG